MGVASEEPACLRVDEWKRERLIGVGADYIVPNFLWHARTDGYALFGWMITLAIDIGGTKFALALFEDGRIVKLERHATDRAGGRDWMLERIRIHRRGLAAQHPHRSLRDRLRRSG